MFRKDMMWERNAQKSILTMGNVLHINTSCHVVKINKYIYVIKPEEQDFSFEPLHCLTVVAMGTPLTTFLWRMKEMT